MLQGVRVDLLRTIGLHVIRLGPGGCVCSIDRQAHSHRHRHQLWKVEHLCRRSFSPCLLRFQVRFNYSGAVQLIGSGLLWLA